MPTPGAGSGRGRTRDTEGDRPPVLVFVYGELLQGQPRDGLLAGRPRRAATVRGHLHRLRGGTPGLVADPDGEPIAGELITLDSPAELMVIDLVLGANEGLLVRATVMAEVGRRTVQAHAHVVPGGRLPPRLKTRDWRRVAPRRERGA